MLHLAREFVVPVAVALILSLVLLPAVRGLRRIRIPAGIGAAIVVLGLVGAFASAIYTLADPARAWLEKAPQGLRALSAKLHEFTGRFEDVSEATAQVRTFTEDLTGADHAAEVTLSSSSLLGDLLGGAGSLSLGIASTLLLLYFLLASGDLFLRKALAATPTLAGQRSTVDFARQVEAAVSRYLFAVTLINVGLGAAMAVALALLGVPNPLMWGVMVAMLNFVPYLGEAIILLALTVVGLLSFDEVWRGLLVPGVFGVLSAIERYLITPTIIGRRLALNPVVIVLSVLFWGAMWGIVGALLAVPILVTLKILCDRVDRLKVFGEFLGA